jgi:hypothetical protein
LTTSSALGLLSWSVPKVDVGKTADRIASQSCTNLETKLSAIQYVCRPFIHNYIRAIVPAFTLLCTLRIDFLPVRPEVRISASGLKLSSSKHFRKRHRTSRMILRVGDSRLCSFDCIMSGRSWATGACKYRLPHSLRFTC